MFNIEYSIMCWKYFRDFTVVNNLEMFMWAEKLFIVIFLEKLIVHFFIAFLEFLSQCFSLHSSEVVRLLLFCLNKLKA